MVTSMRATTHQRPQPSAMTSHAPATPAPAAARREPLRAPASDAPPGHHFAHVSIFPGNAAQPLQTKTVEERPPGEHLAPAGRGRPLPETVQRKMESALGHDFSNVRVHEGRTAESIGAVAFTRGSDLHFAPGRYSPHSRQGQELIGHELAHVVQQRAGRVALPQGKGAPINADPALESEADRLGSTAARAPSSASQSSGGNTRS